MNYKINEVFRTIQGEAKFTGTPCVFIRLQGCGVGCAWCDTKHTWETNDNDRVFDIIAKESDGDSWASMSIQDILDYCNDSGVSHVVLTGGEPFEQDIEPLIEALYRNHFQVQIETSGTVPFDSSPNAWVTVSPKYNMAGGKEVLESCLINADEIKFPVGKDIDVERAAEIQKWFIGDVWLQPLSQSKKATKLCLEACYKHGFNLSIQTHKYIGVR